MEKENGLTLQALIITIIIMIILAGVSIAAVTNPFKEVVNAKNEEENTYYNQVNTTKRNINYIDSSWKNVINKNGIDKELVYNENTKEVTRK